MPKRRAIDDLINKLKDHNVRVRYEQEVRSRLAPILSRYVSLRRDIVKNWSNTEEKPDRPEFGYSIRFHGPNKAFVRANIWIEAADAQGANTSVYELLDQGTRVRYAHMSRNFRRGTTPNSLEVKPSIGGVKFVNKKLPPKPGIEARNWEKILNDRMRPEVIRAVGEAAFNILK